MLSAVEAGGQAALLAPTELLARQHADTLARLLAPLRLVPVLLTGRERGAARRRLYEALATGEAQIAVGTHALFQEGVAYADLALAVIDEQHRFGVAQRARLLEKGRDVHALLMTATPIPRTLALTVYADLDTSVLDEKPPGRAAIRTRWLRRADRERLPAFLRERLEQEEQVYWVAPLIGAEEEDEEQPAVGALRAYRRLARSDLAPFGVELVHGRQEAGERAERLERFRSGAARVLVATTIVEVGVDVPAATVMVVEGAERLGLAQLHQLRGRVGRGAKPSWCLLFGKAGARERLELLERSDCGFELAEEDLRRRGMGELAGLRQSGGPLAGLEGELDLLLAARDALRADPALVRRYAADAPRAAVHAP
jgi:ATP-dependent DNA helicase RecG